MAAGLFLHLGCCDIRLAGAVNVDKVNGPAVDVVADLEKPWPWADNSAREIRAHDVIEHLHDPLHTMSEAYRVLMHGGIFDIVVPTTDGRGAWQDPTHVSFWNRNSFFYFEKGNPHNVRFKIGPKFKILSSVEELLADSVWKLTIVLQAVK